MNETIYPESAAEVPWPTRDYRARVPDTSMLPGSEKPRPAVAGLLKNAAHGAHDTIDRLADGAAPVVRQLGERVHTTVHAHPLACIAAALTLGAVVARITR